MTQTAKNYAQVLQELPVDAESLHTTEQILKEVPEVKESLGNPILSFQVKERIIDRVFPVKMRAFLKVVCRNQKSDMLFEMFEAYRELDRRNRQCLKATLFYVTAPTEEQQEKIKGFLCRKFHVKEAELSLYEDQSLGGGFVLRAGGREFDWSVRGRLQGLTRALQHEQRR